MILRIFWVIGLCVVLVACRSTVPEVDEPIRNQITYALAVDPATFDPHIARSPEVGVVLRQVYDTLVYRHPDTKEIVPGLATDWSVSEDQLIYTFRLRDGVTFHDGTRFDAVAVGINFDRIIELDGYAASLLQYYRGYEIVDGRTIRIRLTEPFSPLLDVLSQFYFGMASPLALSEYSTVRYQFYQTGTGPYRFVDFIPGRHVILGRNEVYQWAPEFYLAESQGVPVERIEYGFLSDETNDDSEKDPFDVVSDLIPTDARSLAVNAQVSVVPTVIPGQPTQFLMNTQQFPTDDLSVRQALLYGTNRNEIAAAIFGGFSPIAWGPLSSNTLYYSREMTGLYEYDIVQSRDLLEVAGYTDSDNDGFVDAEGANLTVTILVPPDDLSAQVARMLQVQWEIIGVVAVLDFEPTQSALEAVVEEGEYNLVAVNTLGFDPHFLSDYYSSEGQLNWTGFQNETLDEILRTGSRESDPVVRAGAYVQAQRAIMNEALVLPIREVTTLTAVNVELQGVEFDAYGWYPFMQNAWLTTARE